MKIGENMVVDLKNISMPYLNILATKNDLVVVGSHDKSLMEFDSGHVGAWIKGA